MIAITYYCQFYMHYLRNYKDPERQIISILVRNQRLEKISYLPTRQGILVSFWLLL